MTCEGKNQGQQRKQKIRDWGREVIKFCLGHGFDIPMKMPGWQLGN